LIQQLVRFVKTTPEESNDGIIKLQIQGDLDPLRQYVKGHAAELYRAEFKYNNSRSLPQNARFHAMATEYGKKVGYTIDEAKEILKRAHGVTIPFGPGFVPPTRPGRFVELYKEIHFHVSTADYTKEEISILMDGTERDMVGV
jgi:hypothetical protein